MNYKAILGILAAVISLIAYIPYFRDILKGKTKPHSFTWFVWSLIVGIGFFIQIQEGAGAGAWVTGITALICLTITILSFIYGEKEIKKMDWVYFMFALLALLSWKLTRNPLIAVFTITLADIFAFLPTMRKGYQKPFGETLSTWILNSLKFVIGIIALESYSLTTYFYPASCVISNGSLVIILLVRRKIIGKV